MTDFSKAEKRDCLSEAGSLSIISSGFNLLFQCIHRLLQSVLLVLVEFSDRVHLLHAMFAKSNLAREVRAVSVEIAHDISTFCGWGAVQTRKHSLTQPGTSVGHRECRTAFASLGVHDVSASVLHMLVHCWNLGRWNLGRMLVLREHWHNCNTCMASDHWHFD